MVVLDDHALYALLHGEAERVADRGVETAVHDAEAACRTNHGTGQPRGVVIFAALDLLAVGARIAPRTTHRWLPIDEQDLHPAMLSLEVALRSFGDVVGDADAIRRVHDRVARD